MALGIDLCFPHHDNELAQWRCGRREKGDADCVIGMSVSVIWFSWITCGPCVDNVRRPRRTTGISSGSTTSYTGQY
eukprot:1738827-Rhodomonas_salina.2